ncbi:MAG: hypothetical protein QOI02_296, partial [Actinomycetota bacterium]|nr:hypothetical protein [Actinomycetota bacterium]
GRGLERREHQQEGQHRPGQHEDQKAFVGRDRAGRDRRQRREHRRDQETGGGRGPADGPADPCAPVSNAEHDRRRHAIEDREARGHTYDIGGPPGRVWASGTTATQNRTFANANSTISRSRKASIARSSVPRRNAATRPASPARLALRPAIEKRNGASGIMQAILQRRPVDRAPRSRIRSCVCLSAGRRNSAFSVIQSPWIARPAAETAARPKKPQHGEHLGEPDDHGERGRDAGPAASTSTFSSSSRDGDESLIPGTWLVRDRGEKGSILMTFPTDLSSRARSKMSAATLAVVGALIIAGCGGGNTPAPSSNGTAPSAAPSTATAPAPAGSPATGTGDDCGATTAALLRTLLTQDGIISITNEGGCHDATIVTSLADSTQGLAICQAAEKVAYAAGDISSITVTGANDKELSIGIKGQSCVGEP